MAFLRLLHRDLRGGLGRVREPGRVSVVLHHRPPSAGRVLLPVSVLHPLYPFFFEGRPPPAIKPNRPFCFSVSGWPRTSPSRSIVFAFDLLRRAGECVATTRPSMTSGLTTLDSPASSASPRSPASAWRTAATC